MSEKTKKFLLYFTSGYGAIWFVLMLFALLSQTHINTGTFGLFGFPIIAAVYAYFQLENKTALEKELEKVREENILLKDLVKSYKGNNTTESF